MYSVVLVMALAGSAETPDCGHKHHGGCYGGCTGCYGGCTGSYGGCTGCNGGCTGGCVGYVGCVGTPTASYGSPTMNVAMPQTIRPAVASAAPAKILVTLPAQAKLTIDGYVSNQTSGTRQLVTPALEPGQVYTYTLVATTTQNGQPVQLTQKVTVRAGQTTPVSFTFSNAPAAASR